MTLCCFTLQCWLVVQLVLDAHSSRKRSRRYLKNCTQTCHRRCNKHRLNTPTFLPKAVEESEICVSDRDGLLTAFPLWMSSCSTWKHHLDGLDSCCSQPTYTPSEGHERGYSHSHAAHAHPRAEVVKRKFGIVSERRPLYDCVHWYSKDSDHTRTCSLDAMTYWLSWCFDDQLRQRPWTIYINK